DLHLERPGRRPLLLPLLIQLLRLVVAHRESSILPCRGWGLGGEGRSKLRPYRSLTAGRRRERPCDRSPTCLARWRIAKLLTYELRFVGARLRTELLNAAVEDLGQIEVAVLIGRDRMRAVELSRLLARDAPP